jgi:hypothetical protein
VSDIFAEFLTKFGFSLFFYNGPLMLNFMEIYPVEVALIHVGLPKLIDAFHDYVGHTKNGYNILSASLKGRDVGT